MQLWWQRGCSTAAVLSLGLWLGVQHPITTALPFLCSTAVRPRSALKPHAALRPGLQFPALCFARDAHLGSTHPAAAPWHCCVIVAVCWG